MADMHHRLALFNIFFHLRHMQTDIFESIIIMYNSGNSYFTYRLNIKKQLPFSYL